MRAMRMPLLPCLFAVSLAACVTSGDSPFCEGGDCPGGGACGDGTCAPGEDCAGCAEDCGPCDGDGDGGGGGADASCLDYDSEVQPILDQSCTVCHAGADPAGGLSLASHDAVLAGGDSGSPVAPGDCGGSLLYLITGPDPPGGLRMPANGPPYLSDQDRETLCRWIDEGALASADECATDPSDPSDPSSGTGDGSEDVTAPAFEGIDWIAELASECELFWVEATDDQTPAPEIEYRIYYAEDDQPLDYSAPAETVLGADLAPGGDPNERRWSIAPPPGRRYQVAVRAADAAGNADANQEVASCDLR